MTLNITITSDFICPWCLIGEHRLDTREVRDAERAVQGGGVRSVPQFDIDGEIVSGAQSVAVFEAALRRAVAQQDDCSNGACSLS
ncbi:hypothetical protein BKK79_22510 [Cupriavidus sp. USMAA2-4]|uniref:hypothetical protein n=1 Tax=Cupriavidus sp. USMAA2-4 TaxID=876364 RepID=UPI0008A6AB59|nr:hypothetical protein [Cupriavidus sp. USMAA2-4]AOY94679.1 hypothetical protein BKK79_22510 [Cupriavidus sp. USMAA2-4]